MMRIMGAERARGMSRTRLACVALAFGTGLGAPQAAWAQTPAIDLSGDIRFRLEQDWDSRTDAGAKREERTRARVRLRVGAEVELAEGLVARGRVRTGGDSQQSANITVIDFDGNATGPVKVVADRYSLAWQGERAGAEVGRMAFPFYTQNEYMWDGDVSPLGAAARVDVPVLEDATLTLRGAALLLPAGLDGFSGSLYAGQAQAEAGQSVLAAGVFAFRPDRSDPDRLLLADGNGERDYTILALNAQQRVPLAGKPLRLGADFYRNLEDYSDSPDPFTQANRDERTGYVLSAIWGATSEAGDFEVGYRYSRIERFAVHGSYSQDDTARFAAGSQARLTGLKGHDLFANYAITDQLAAGVRLMFAERLDSPEDGKRARLDLIYSF